MQITNYTYSVANDTDNGKVVLSRLDREIRDSNVTIALDGISVSGDVLTITFKDVLPVADQTELNDVVATHDGTPLDSVEPALDEKGNQVVVLDGGRTAIGMQSVQVLNTPDISSDLIKSYQISVPPNMTEILDIFIGEDLTGPEGRCFLAGGEYRCRTPAVEGSALHFSIVDRNDVLGYFALYGMSRTKMTGITFQTGSMADIQPGDDVWGTSSGAHTVVISTNGADEMDIYFHEVEFQDGEPLTFTRGGAPIAATATLGTWVEGDVIEVLKSVKDEWIEGLDQRDIQPGGSREVPEGMYFRVRAFNAETDVGQPDLRIKVSLTVGRL